MSVFTKVKDYVTKPKRNTFDLSYQNNLTMEFGKLYPVFCKEVVPGDSMRIKPTFGLRFMPLVFPIQTRMQANLHFFYVRNRNLWKDWPDFIGRTKQNLVAPFLSPDIAKKVCRTRGLGDYFGLPTTLAGSYGRNIVISPDGLYRTLTGNQAYVLPYRDYVNNGMSNSQNWSNKTYNQIMAQVDASGAYAPSINVSQASGAFTDVLEGQVDILNATLQYRKITVPHDAPDDNDGLTSTVDIITMKTSDAQAIGNSALFAMRTLYVGLYVEDGTDYVNVCRWEVANAFNNQTTLDKQYSIFSLLNSGSKVNGPAWSILPWESGVAVTPSYIFDRVGASGRKWRLAFWNYGAEFFQHNNVVYNGSMFSRNNAIPKSVEGVIPVNGGFGIINVTLPQVATDVLDVANMDALYNPYASGALHVSALPFRAYESIYNAFYRNQFNDPFMLNGQKEYNRFITNNEGGEDHTDYDFMFRNYEQDFLTTAKQSPVDGDVTPLVGVSGTGVFTFQNSDGTQVNITPKFGPDGTTIVGLETVEGTPENPSSIRRLMDMASVGISINDFRNVNALQRWLETNLRRGYRYKDQLMSHFGVEAKFDVLDMPEFIGGMSEPVMVNQINQSVDQTGNASGLGDFSKVLGSFAGQASVLAQSKHDVEKYCDEHGFIIGILSITPVPNYSQLLPKMFLKNNVLDYYFPEFGHIGNQPIPYSEVCPLQSYAAAAAGGTEKLTDVFGYQRAWYDYLSSVDEVHGDFRKSLEGFLINRVFDDRPELGIDFLKVDPETMSNPFSVTDETDKIIGQVFFDVTAQRPIPKFGIPRLEA